MSKLEAEVNKISRTEFFVKTLATGFALATLPSCSTLITTDTSGIIASEIKVSVKDGTIPAYHAYPQNGMNLPIVLVVQEIFGVHEHIKDICRRFAKLGYYAIAPELYARQGDVSIMTDFKEILGKVVSKVPDQQVMSDLDASLAHAVSTKLVDANKLGITGFCWGGRITWLYAAHNPQVKAAGAWYGRLTADKSPLQPMHPIDIAAKLKKTPVLGLYAGKDMGIPLEQVDKMKEALSKAGSPSEIIVYPDVEHGFNADYRPMYNEKAAKDAWGKLLAWFQKNGVA